MLTVLTLKASHFLMCIMFFSAPSVDCNADNGGCHVFAICSQIAVDKVNCSCKGGYHGDGYYCELSDVCLINNGYCDTNATCLFTGPVSLQFH